jgi:hypothetical protein
VGLRAGRHSGLSVVWLLAALGGAQKKPAPETEAAKPSSGAERRTELNLLARTDAAAGESRRNENVQFNLIDNNALEELVGTN